MTDRTAPVEGVWHMLTESGAYYRLDLDAMTVRRHPTGSAMRRDNQELVLWALAHAEVGRPALMLVSVRGDLVITARATTTVTSLIPETVDGTDG